MMKSASMGLKGFIQSGTTSVENYYTSKMDNYSSTLYTLDSIFRVALQPFIPMHDRPSLFTPL